MMDTGMLFTVAQIAAPAVAAWVAVKVGIEKAMFTAMEAKTTADKAHARIDSILERQRA